MKRTPSKIIGRIAGFVGLSFFDPSFVKFLRMHSFFNIGANLSGVFVGTFFLRAGGDFITVGLFYLVGFFVEAIGNFFSVGLARKYAITNLTRFGLALYTAYYLLLLLAPGFSVKYFPVVAALNALGNALFWMPFHNYCILYTHPGNRQRGMSIMGMVGNFIALVTPMIAGIITSKLPGATGYTVIFTVSVAAFVSSALCTKGMPSQPTGQKKNPLLSILSEYRKVAVHSMSLMHFFYGLRDGIYLYYFNILIYNLLNNEMIVGVSASIRSLAAVLIFFAIVRLTTKERRVIAFFISSAAGIIAAVCLSAVTSAAVIIIVYIVDSVLQTVSYNGMQFAAYDLAEYITTNEENRRPAAISLRNMSLNLGRTVGIAAFLLLPAAEGSVWPLIIMNIFTIPAALCYLRLSKALKTPYESAAA